MSFRHSEFFTLDEVADYFGVNKSTVSRWHERGQLKEDMLGHNGDLYFAIDNVLEFTPPKARDSKLDSLKAQLRDNSKALTEFDTEKNVALEKLRNLETFDSDSVFAETT